MVPITSEKATGSASAAPPHAMARRFHRQNDRVDSIVLRLDAVRSSRNLAALVVGVTSTDRRSGVSGLAREVAIRAADLDLGRVLLMDLNLDAASQAKALKAQGQAGVAEVLMGELKPQEVIWSGKIGGFHFMTAGRPSNCQQVVVTPEFTSGLIREMREEFQIVILDLPIIASTTRFLVPSAYTDGLALIIDAQQTRSRKALSALQLLQENKIEILGCVLNREARNLPGWMERWF